MSYKKEDFTSFEITSLDGERLMYTESNFDFPIMYDLNDNIIDNMLMIKGRRMPEIDTSQYVYVIARMRDGDRNETAFRAQFDKDVAAKSAFANVNLSVLGIS